MRPSQLLCSLVVALAAQWGYAAVTDAPDAGLVVQRAQELLTQGRAAQALSTLQPTLVELEAQKSPEPQRKCSSRTVEESLACLVEAASLDQSAVEVGPAYAMAYYLRAYAHIELGQLAEAQGALDRARQLAPRNSMVLAEMGHLRLRAKDWGGALVLFEQAAQNADLAPASTRTQERSRAWRGAGYALVELGRLADARAMYENCLQVDSSDVRAAQELAYVRKMESRRKTPMVPAPGTTPSRATQ